MISTNWNTSINRSDILPPTTVSKSIRDGDKWKKAMLDSFEYIAKLQLKENLKFWDYYRMVDGKMSYMELKEALPHLDKLEDLLNGSGVPTFLKHYDILGTMVRDVVGKFMDLDDKFHVTDSGEIAQNEFLRYKNKEITESLQQAIEVEVNLLLAEEGLTAEGKKFNSQEEQQAFMQQMEQRKQQLIPKDAKRNSNTPYKTLGIKYGEAVLEHDKIRFDIKALERQEMTDKLLTGRWFREYVITGDRYYPENWSPKNTFFSKELGIKNPQKGEYIGRLGLKTPSEIINKHGHRIPTDVQKELLGGNSTWRNFIGGQGQSGSISAAVKHNFNKTARVPFAGHDTYNFYLALEEDLGIPMGEMTQINKDGTSRTTERFLPRYQNRYQGANTFYANVLRDDFEHRKDLCEELEVYFIVREKYGFLTYEDSNGMINTVEVTEDILPEVLKEYGIKTTYKESLHQVISREDLKVNTLSWMLRPVCYKGIKINSGNLKEPYYLMCEKYEHQIKGDSMFEILLPVGGEIGKPWADKIFPYQSAYNLVMNQIQNLLEKEIGIFFLLDVSLIPSEIDGWGDAEEALIEMKGLARDIGILPVQTSGDSLKNQNNFNQFTTHNLTYAGQVQYRIGLADKYKALAYEALGPNPQTAMQPNKYTTAEGVKVSQEAVMSQLVELFEDYQSAKGKCLGVHLSVAQYCQSNNKDITFHYTKDDASTAFLRITDPDLSLRNLGLIPAQDPKSRKALENYKNYLMSNNTVQADFVEVAKLMSSDTMTELLDVALNAKEKQQQAGQEEHNRKMQEIERQGQMAEEKAVRDHERDIELQREVNKGRILTAEVNAKGRAADKKAEQGAYTEIEESSKDAVAKLGIQNNNQIKNRELDIKEKSEDEAKNIRMEELKLRAQELRAKLQMKNQDVSIAAMNKN